MTTIIKKQCGTILLLSLLIHSQAQDRAQDHNASMSNFTASKAKLDDWTFGVNGGASFTVRSNESSLFRGNSMAAKIFSRYHFGNIGLGFSGGNITGAISGDALNKFMVDRKLQQAQINKSNPSNSYLLFGPSFRFGNRVMVIADIQGGMFINNPGSVSVAQAGAARQLYRFEGAAKNLFPGFSGNISLAYPINHSTRFVINSEYLHSKSSIRVYDPQQGIDIPVEQERPLRLFAMGIGITKSFGSKRDAGSEMTAEKKHVGNVKYGNRIIRESEATGERIISATQRYAINTIGTAAANGRITNNENCGPVTQKITYPDGTSEELSFVCLGDAAIYNERTNKTVTVPKQTQGTTFGEKVNAGLHAAGSALSQGASRGVISGRVSWSANNSAGIITNQNAVSSVGSISGGGSGSGSASYAATGKMMSYSTSPTGIATTIYTREAGSGMATGKRSARENGSGMATGKRQYTPVYKEGETNTCTGCVVAIKLVAHEATHVVQQTQAQNNPLYNDNGHQGTNPLYEDNGNLRKGADNDCDGVAGLNIYLIDINNGAVVANTKTTTYGDFFFANVPSASYLVRVKGGVSRTKIYEATVNGKGKVDMAGEITASGDHWVMQLNTENNNMQKAGISTSRSNNRPRSINIIETDIDGNGEFEPAKIIMEFDDGSSMDVTGNSKITSAFGNKKVVVRGWDPKKKEQKTNNTNPTTEYAISIDSDNEITITSQYENGTKKEARVISKVSYHPNVIQWIIPVNDTNADAAVIKTKTKSNQSNDRMVDVANGGNDNSRSYTKTLLSFIGDVDGDGISEILTGNTFAASNRTINQGASLLGGALPGGAVISAFAMPGNPIGGIIVKGGKNPGGSLRTTQTNEHGEFEFTAMEKGTYSISAEVTYYLDDETIVTVGDEEYVDGEETAERKGWDGTAKGGSKTVVKIDDGIAARKGWDGTVKGGSKINAIEDNNSSAKQSAEQDHNSSSSNKAEIIVENNPGDGTTAKSIVNTTKSNTKDFLVSLDELDELLNADKTTSLSAIQSIKENSRVLRSSYQKLENSLQSSGDVEKAVNDADTNFVVLLGSLGKLGQHYNSISNVLKTKHDTAKNSVGNIR
jgi:hypothetical protein